MITLYSDPECPLCHKTRFVIQEKGIAASIEDTRDTHWPEAIATANPYGQSPVLTDRELILYDSSIIIAYLEERFAHPALMPADPASRAKARLMLHRIDRDWYSLWDNLTSKSKKSISKTKQAIKDDLTVLTPLFNDSAFFLNGSFSLIDCSLAPLLWRLPMLGIKLPAKAKAVENYAQQIFARPTFQASLTDSERAMR